MSEACTMSSFCSYKTKAIARILVSLYSFVVIVDPTSTFFHLKELSFFSLLIYCCYAYKIKITHLIPFCLALLVWLLSSSIGYSSDNIVNTSFNIGILISLLPILTLGWIDNLNVLKSLHTPCIIVSMINILIVTAMQSFPILSGYLYNLLCIQYDVAMISNRDFMGIQFYSAFYRTTPVICIPLALNLYSYVTHKQSRSKWNLVGIIILAWGLFAGGNRMSMVSAILIVGIFVFLKLFSAKGLRIVTIPIILAVSVVFVVLISSLASDKSEASNIVKYGHLLSYQELFENNPFSLFLGFGSGSEIFSYGANMRLLNTEWSYLELVRFFGMIGGVIVIGIYIYPLLVIWKFKLGYRWLPLLVGYGTYLIFAGTNPLLLSSTGTIVLLAMYSYIWNSKLHYSN